MGKSVGILWPRQYQGSGTFPESFDVGREAVALGSCAVWVVFLDVEVHSIKAIALGLAHKSGDETYPLSWMVRPGIKAKR